MTSKLDTEPEKESSSELPILAPAQEIQKAEPDQPPKPDKDLEAPILCLFLGSDRDAEQRSLLDESVDADLR